MRKQLVELLVEAGYEAVALIDSPFWTQKMSERYGLSSTSSERHAAFASGLGTFGLCDGLITPVGKAMRCGSVVAHIQIPPSQRPCKNAPGLLPVLLQGHLRQMRGSLSCRRHQQRKGARQRKMQGLRFGHHEGVRCLRFRVCGLCVRILSGRRALRIADSGYDKRVTGHGSGCRVQSRPHKAQTVARGMQ